MAPATLLDYNGSRASTPETVSDKTTTDSRRNGHSYEDHTFRTTTPDEDVSVKGVEPIAIIGMGCRLPGGVSTTSSLWELLKSGKTAQGRFPKARFNIDSFYHPDGDRPGSLNTEGGYFIEEDIRAFENSFFGINNLEATYMDPQQRKLLEVVFESFENAGLSLEELSGSNVGCYVGNFVTDFITMQLKDAEYTHRYSATGLGTTILANRISHVFNLKGPSFVIDTACSSSLYCLHAACTALQQRECDMAVVAGANLVQSPEQQLATMNAGVLSKTSTCHTFDASADGYGRADGIGSLVVKRLSDAIRDNDPIRAVVRGTAVNSNGKTNGITLPSADGQEAVIRKAYAQAGLGYDATTYVECHGTGTAVGDPIEVEAVSRVFKRPASAPPLLIGSVKTNLGHSEAASGISSIIKVVLALEKKRIPPTIGVAKFNPKLKLDDWNIQIVTQSTPWPLVDSPHGQEGKLRRAGVNSFGYGGANAHAILEAPELHMPLNSSILESEESKMETAIWRSSMLLPISASNKTALEQRVTDVAAAIDLDQVNVVDLAYTLGVRRSHLPVRGFLLVRPGLLRADFSLDNLQTHADGKPYSKLPITFAFTGQGAQWPEMGRELLAEFPSFRKTIQSLDSTLQLLPHPPSWTLFAALLEPAATSMINDASRSQPVCTAVQIAFVRLLATFGITPANVVGHSSGEICAAYCAGWITAKQAITVAYYRGYTVTTSANARVGAMLAAGLGSAEATQMIQDLGLASDIGVACINSPESVTVSGEVQSIDALKAHLDGCNVFARVLKTNGKAYHSHQMAAFGQEYEDHMVAAGMRGRFATTNGHIVPSGPCVRWISSVTTQNIDHAVDASYWRANLESPVQFSDAVEKILKEGPQHFIEIGPHSALELPIKQIRAKMNMGEDKVHYGATLSRGKNSVHTLLQLVGNLYLHGHTLAFDNVNVSEPWPIKSIESGSEAKRGSMLLDLPRYAWDHDPQQQLFNEPRISVEWRNRKNPRHDLLGSQQHGGNGILATWRNVLKSKDVPWIEGHKLDTTVVCPAACYLAIAIEAMTQLEAGEHDFEHHGSALRLWDIKITKALILPGREEAGAAGVEIFTTLEPYQLPGGRAAGWYQFKISSYAYEEATIHASGFAKFIPTWEPTIDQAFAGIKAENMEPSAPRTWYNKFAECGLVFQEHFQSLSQIHLNRKRDQMQVLAETKVRQGGDVQTHESRYLLHPVTIDAIFQAGIIASTCGNVRDLLAKVPVHIEQMVVRRPMSAGNRGIQPTPGGLNVTAISEPVGFGTIKVSGELRDDTGQAVLQISQCRQILFQSGTQIPNGSSASNKDERHPMLRVIWKPDIARLGPADSAVFSSHVEQVVDKVAPRGLGELELGMARLEAVLDLLAHKNSRRRILTLSTSETEERRLVEVLRLKTDFKRCHSLWRGSFADDQGIRVQQVNLDVSSETRSQTSASGSEDQFDLVIIGRSQGRYNAEARLAAANKVITDDGILLSAASTEETKIVESSEFAMQLQTQIGGCDEITIARPIKGLDAGTNGLPTSLEEVLLVRRNAHHPFNNVLTSTLSSIVGSKTKLVSLEDLTPDLVRAYPTVISTVELEDAILSQVTEDDMAFIKLMTDHASKIIWVTGGSLLHGGKPEMGVVFGLSRALMLEQPSLHVFAVDVNIEAASAQQDQAMNTAARHVAEVLRQAVAASEPDFEFISSSGMLHVSRFVPDETMNRTFREKQGVETKALALGEACPCRLDMATVGQTDSIFFRPDESIADTPLPTGFVDVSVKTIGLTGRDLRAISGHADKSGGAICVHQFCAEVVRVGKEVDSLVPGDRVVVLAPGRFATLERVAAWACYKLREDETFTSMASLPLPLTTAVHAIYESARLQENERILVCCSSAGEGEGADLAALQIAQLVVHAQVFALVPTVEAGEHLVQGLGLQPAHVVIANGTSKGATKALLEATGHRGFDVIINFCERDLPAAVSLGALCASLSRVVQVGGSGHAFIQALALDPTMLQKNIAYSTLDMGDIVRSETPAVEVLRRRLLAKAISLYHQGTLGSLDSLPRVYDVSAVGDAFNALAAAKQDEEGHGPWQAVVVALENDESTIPCRPVKYDSVFSSDKTYLLVGCLGGLGRSISKWMLARGARKFVFMGRSGTVKAPARRVVEDLQNWGATVSVVRGDVVNYEDVERAVQCIDGAIGGVVQAAMGLGESLFTAMPRKNWLDGLKPKIIGSWNLHNAIQGRDQELDFFLMTSSVSGSVGTATESNYCSANYFLDIFARHRRSLGLPATSVGLGMISEVGYLHENPEIEALLLRKGIQAINEDEMLQILDISLSRAAGPEAPTLSPSFALASGTSYDELAMGHVLTGLEPLALKAIRAKGFEGSSPVLGDPRASMLSAALDEDTTGTISGGSSASKGFAADIAKAIDEGSSLNEAVLQMTAKKFSSLVLVPREKLDVSKAISGVGVDSMLAAEFRAWIFSAFKVDIPYLTLLSSAATLTMLSEMIAKELVESKDI